MSIEKNKMLYRDDRVIKKKSFIFKTFSPVFLYFINHNFFSDFKLYLFQNYFKFCSISVNYVSKVNSLLT